MLVKRSGWCAMEGGTAYYENNEPLICEWREVDHHVYYLDEHGRACRGWAGVSGEWYFFSLTDRAQALNGKRYPQYALYRETFIQDDDRDERGDVILYYVDGEGRMVHGLYTIGGVSYYFARREVHGRRGLHYLEGMMYRDDWFEDFSDGKLYFFERSGHMVRNRTQTIGSVRYHFNESGAATPLGAAESRRRERSGWVTIEGEFYYLESGAPLRGAWHEEGEARFYLQPDGRAASGWTALDGGALFFFASPHAGEAPSLLRGRFVDSFESALTTTTPTASAVTISRERFGPVSAGSATVVGGEPFSEVDPASPSSPSESPRPGPEGSIRRYVSEDGAMARGLVTIGEQTFYFAESPYHCAYSGRVYQDGEMYSSEWLPGLDGLRYFKEGGEMACNESIVLFSVEYHFDERGLNSGYAYKCRRLQ